MTGRRSFLKAVCAAALAGPNVRADANRLPPQGALQEAREAVEAGALGSIGFCRVAHAGWRPAVAFVLGKADGSLVVDTDPAGEGCSLLGSRATLALNRDGYRLFPTDA